MKPRDELERQLWELVYGLLDDDEADRLCERITSEPDVARAYAKAQLQAELLGRAARLDRSPVALETPAEHDPAGSSPVSPRPSSARARAAGGPAVWPQRLVALAAMLLLGFLGYAYLRVNGPAAQLADRFAAPPADAETTSIRMRLTTPAHLDRAAENPLLVQTLTSDGEPFETDLLYNVYGPDRTLRSQSRAVTDARGVSRVTLAGQDLPENALLEVAPVSSGGQGNAVADLQVLAGAQETFVATDKPDYRQGETMRFRSLTVSRVDLQAESERSIQFQIEDPSGQVLPDSQRSLQIQRGVGLGEYRFADSAPAGNYALVLSSPDGTFPVQRHGVSLESASTPAEGARAAASLVQGRQLDSAEAFSSTASQFAVSFFPEGGQLVAGVPSNVYFQARGPSGAPAELAGRVVDDQAAEVARLETVHQGRGQFELAPQPGTTYQLILDQADLQSPPINLPPPAGSSSVVVHVETAILEGGQPALVELRARQPAGPLLLATYCRGAMVGLERVELEDFEPRPGGYFAARSSVPLAAAGVVRITVFDETGARPPRPLAERWIFGRPTQQLAVELENLAPEYPAGEVVDLIIRTRDESSAPRPAGLAVSIVAEALLGADASPVPTLPAYFYLGSELKEDRDQQLADFYLQQAPTSVEALDLLLGTMSAQRPAEQSLVLLADRIRADSARFEREARDEFSYFDSASQSGSAPEAAVPPPQLVEVEAIVAAPARVASRPRTTDRLARTLSRIAVAAGGGLLALIFVLVAAHRLSRPGVWVPSLAVAVVSLLAGLLLWPPRSGPGELAFAPTSAPADDAARTEALGIDRMARAVSAPGVGGDVRTAAETERENTPRMPDARSSETLDAQPDADASTRLSAGPATAVDRLPKQYAKQTDSIRQRAAQEQQPARPASQLGRAAAAGNRRMERSLREADKQTSRHALREEANASPTPSALDAVNEPPASRSLERTLGGMLPAITPGNRPEAPRLDFGAASSTSPVWIPSLNTGESGQARVRFQLPETPGAFRIRADAHAPGRLGSIDARIVVRPPD